MSRFAIFPAAALAMGPGPNGLAKTPPMGWMSWEIFRCETDCTSHPSSCINEQLYMEMSDALVDDGYLSVGYNTVSIDDCWENLNGRNSDGALFPDAARFPAGMKALGDHMHSKGVNFGIYSDEGTRTCGGFPGSLGFEEADANTFASWGVDYLKLDGCYNNESGFVTGYPAMGTALQGTGRNMTYSCSWPAYLHDEEGAKPFDAMIQAGCNSWRNWEDIQCGWQSLVQIIDHWGQYGEAMAPYAGPGHWHDPDMLIIGNGCITLEEEQTQMALWCIVAAPLILGNDLRHVPEQSAAILKNNDAIAVNQDPLGKMGTRMSATNLSTQVWTRELAGGDVAVALYNYDGGTPAGTSLVAGGQYCSDALAMGSDTGFGYNLATCVSAVRSESRCQSGFFYFAASYNGQCKCALDDCSERDSSAAHNIYKLSDEFALGADIQVSFQDLGLPESVAVYDIWAQSALGTFTGSYTAVNVSLHGTAFLRLSSLPALINVLV